MEESMETEENGKGPLGSGYKMTRACQSGSNESIGNMMNFGVTGFETYLI